MTDQMLRDLLEERVADVTMRDVSAVAWRDGRRSRRRDRLAVAGAAGLATAAVTVGVALLVDDGATTGPSPAPGVPTSTPAPDPGQPDAAYEGVPVWWSLSQAQEVNLPRVEDAPLPEVIDLEAGPRVKAMSQAVAAFWVDDRVVLVDMDGGQLSVDVSGLDKVTKPNGYRFRPPHQSMLSPEGSHLVFPQDGRVLVYALVTGEWREIDTGDARTLDVRWLDEGVFVLPQNGSGSSGPTWTVSGSSGGWHGIPRAEPGFGTLTAQAFGPTRSSGSSSAQAWGMGVPVPVADAGTYLSEPEFIAANVGGEPSVLAMMWDIRDEGHGGRFLQCCPVAGWLDDQTLVYESRQSQPALVAWTVGTDDFGLVSRIEGQYLLASFADLG